MWYEGPMKYPSDWPGPGPIDLRVHDLPHHSAATEWWYVNSHVTTADGRSLSLFAAFFRIALGRDEPTKEMRYAHALTWALSDADGHVYRADSRVDAAAPKIGLQRLERGQGTRDPRLNKAIREVLERGKVPLPDRPFEGAIFVNDKRLELDFAGCRFEKRDDGAYQVTLHDPITRAGCELVFTPQVAPVRHGDDGVVTGHGGDEMFYYFIPRCSLTGTVTLDGQTTALKSGQGWYDHEFGGDFTNERGDTADLAWNWLSAQLDDGTQLSAYTLADAATGQQLYQRVVLIDRDGRPKTLDDFTLVAAAPWRSMRTFNDYPTKWQLEVPSEKLSLTVEASFPDQEFITVLSHPAFWEGRTKVHGTRAGQSVTGLGYVERSGWETVHDLDGFFGAVGEVVRASVASLLPLEPTFVEARDLVASAEREHYMDGLDVAQLSRALFRPIRDVADRGGKSWRSYAALVCCDVVGGDSRKFAKWLAMPELMHVGSLIVDDVQDRSEVRRGGPTCHLVHGEPLAINAGTAAYFMGQRLLVGNDVSAASKLRLYDLYFEALRAGHAGQAIDLDGMSHLLREVAATGDAALLERRVLATHRLKTAAPAGALARMGALVGGGSEAQIEAVGRFFEALGLAFQLIDDVLNLRGFKGELKSCGEDVGNGTVTIPVAKAMARFDAAERRWLCEILTAKPKDDPATIAKVIAEMERVGAIEAAAQEARELVEAAWDAAEPLLEDSMPKVMLRAFGWYVLDRHY